MIVLLALFAAVRRATADCACGYTVNATSSGDYSLFTEALETDFSHTGNVTWDSQPGVAWQAQAYNTTPAAARGPYGKAAQVGNVVLDGGDAGLQLWVRSRLLDDGGGGQLVPIAEVVTARSDILYGSFRVGMKTTAVNGTCGAFFFYHNDSEEIDMEILSRQQQQSATTHPINLVNQSPESVSSGYNAVNSSGFLLFNLTYDPTQAYNEYRFDWLPNRIDMYADNIKLHSFYDSVPSAPGALHLIHWSNGDPGWSGGPPTEDAVLTVRYVNAYFNTSSSSSLSAQCADGPVSAENTCEISNTTQPGTLSSGSPSATTSNSGSSTPTPSHSSASGRRVGYTLPFFITGGLVAMML